jgi:hypothetical protein
MATRTIERRLEDLELRHSGGEDGCPRCRATLIVIRNVTGEFDSAKALYEGTSDNLSAEELQERETEDHCARCGTAREFSRSSVIKIGGAS